MRLVMAGVAVVMALVVAAPAQAALPSAPALPVQQTVDSASSTVQSTVASTAGAVQGQATKGVAAAKQVASHVPPPPAAPKPPRPHVAPPSPPAVPRVTLPAPPTPVDTAPVQGVGREIGGYRKKLVQPPSDVQPVKPVGDVVALLGNTLRKIAPSVGTLLAPVQPLLADLGDLNGLDRRALGAVLSPGKAQTLGAVRSGALAPPPTGGALSSYRAPAPTAGSPAQSFQAASARPPAAEVGGRPVSPPPRTAPAPVAGGAAAGFAGGVFVPFLGLLVLAALAAPRLMRRLDELPAFVRPAPFLCALERPG